MAKAVVPSSIVFEVLEKDNYEDWSETIRAYLEFKDLWDVVESDEQPPDEAIFKAWKKKNCEALHAIKISCGRHFLSKIRGIREANKAWRTLQANFNPHLHRRMTSTTNPQQEFASKLLKEYPRLIFAKDVNGISPLYTAARAPYIFFNERYEHKFSKFIPDFLRLQLPLHSIDFKISGIELLIAMRNTIRDLNMTSGLLRDAFFEAIKCDNFNFLIMLINADKFFLEEVKDMSKNIYVCAIEYRRANVFSLILWDKKDWKDRDQYANVLQDKWKNNLLHMAATWTPPNALDRISKPAVLMTSEVMWFQVLQVNNLLLVTDG